MKRYGDLALPPGFIEAENQRARTQRILSKRRKANKVARVSRRRNRG